MTNRTAAVALAVFALSGVTRAQDLTPRPPAPGGPVLITGATIHTISGETVENGAVMFEGDTITRVDDGAWLKVALLAPDVVRIDATGKHLYPGMFASDTVIGLMEVSSVRATLDYDERGDFTPEVRACVSVNPDSTLIPVTRINGVLLAGVFPTGGRVPGRISVLRLNGWTWEDMTVDPSAGLALTWPRMRPFQRPFDDDTRRPRRGGGDESIAEDLKALDAFFDGAESYAALTASHDRDERLESMRPFISGDSRSPIFIEADDVDQITAAVTWCAERDYRCVIVGGRDADRCAEILKKYDVPVIVTGLYRFPRRADAPVDEAYTLPIRLERAGIRFAIDSSEREGNTRNLPYEAAMARRYGLSDAATLRAITLAPAEIFGVADRYGSLAPGKSATFFLADGDILEASTRVERVFIEGRDIPMRSKQTDLRDKYAEKYRQLGMIK